MNKQESSKKGQALKLASLETTFYLYDEKRHNVEFSSAADFDAWALTFVEEIVNVKRDIWDIFARWKFVNWLLDEGLVYPQIEDDGILLLEEKASSEVEAFSSSPDVKNVDELAQEAG